MSPKLDNLATVLEEELALTCRLLDLAKDARAATIAVDPVLLTQIVAEQEARAAELEAAEARRAAVVGELVGELGLPADGPVKLSQIIGRAGHADAARLRRVGGRLRGTAADLRQTTSRNRALLESALTHVDEFFAVVAEKGRPPAAYSPAGTVPSETAAVLMDRKA